ncbi:MAG: hypothetical protein ABI780_09920 [Ardenticatenales bacterium]
MTMDALDILIKLERIHCYDEGDGIGNAEPYLWAVFFKIDGETAFVDDHLTLQGTARVFVSLHSHGNLGTTDVDAGDDVAVPAQFGYGDLLTPIPLRPPVFGTSEIGGIVGCVAILMEQDNSSDEAAEAGRAALFSAVQAALDGLIPKITMRNPSPSPEDVQGLKDQVAASVEGAIWDHTRLYGWIAAGTNVDDNIGSEIFDYSQEDLFGAGPSGKAFSTRWNNEGDWEIFGRIDVKWSAWEDLTGTLSAAPAVASWQENRLDVFVRGPQDHMWHRWWGGAGWSVWEDLGGPPNIPLPISTHARARVRPPIDSVLSNGPLASAPAAVSWGPNRIDTFARGMDRHLWHKWWDGAAWSDWHDLGGSLTSAPAVASWQANRLDVFARDDHNHLCHKWSDGTAWSDWEDLGGILTTAPAAVSWGPNRIDVFGRGTNDHLFHKWWAGGWSDWEDLGGSLAAAPAAVSRRDNNLDCFVRGTDNQMWHKGWDGTAWGDWRAVGGGLADSPAAVSWGSDRIDAFVRGTDDHLWHAWWG